MTSLAFMFDWVPEPVCQTRSGNSASRTPAATSAAAAAMNSSFSAARMPSSAFTSAAARFRIPKACTTRSGIVSLLIAKKCSDRWVWAPQ